MGVQHSPTISDTTLTYSCAKCIGPDNNEMVQCDNRNCNKWYHYSCVGVTHDEVARKKWKCDKCIPVPTVTSNEIRPIVQLHDNTVTNEEEINTNVPIQSSNKNPSVKAKSIKSSSRKSKHHRRDLAIQRLNEERILQEKRDREYLSKKYQILEQTYTSDEDSSEVDSTSKVQEWLTNESHDTTNHKNADTNNASNCGGDRVNSSHSDHRNVIPHAHQLNLVHSSETNVNLHQSNVLNSNTCTVSRSNQLNVLNSNDTNVMPAYSSNPVSCSANVPRNDNTIFQQSQSTQCQQPSLNMTSLQYNLYNQQSAPANISRFNNNVNTNPVSVYIPESSNQMQQVHIQSTGAVPKMYHIPEKSSGIRMGYSEQIIPTNHAINTSTADDQRNSYKSCMGYITTRFAQMYDAPNRYLDSTKLLTTHKIPRVAEIQMSSHSQSEFRNDPETMCDTPEFRNHPLNYIGPSNEKIKLHQLNNDGPSHEAVVQNKNQISASSTLNSNQIAARHAISKELPYFSGVYDEWPLFISSFETSTRTCNFSNEENLIRLQKALKGKALDAVRCKLLLPSHVPDIIASLRMLFGRPELIISSLLQKVRKQPAPRIHDFGGLIQFSLMVQNLCATMEASGMEAYLFNPSLIQEITDKLPAEIKLNWAMYKRTLPHVTLSTLSLWLTDLAYAASDVTVSTDLIQQTDIQYNKRDKKFNKASVLNAHIQSAESNSIVQSSESSANAVTKPKDVKFCCICNGSCKSVGECKRFINLSLNKKWSAVQDNKLCRKCLHRHGKFGCKASANVCGKNNCQFKHHRLLHNDNKDKHKTCNKVVVATQLKCNGNEKEKSSILFRILPVVVSNRNKSIETFAFLDDGSSITLIERGLSDELGLDGQVDPLCLKWTGDVHRSENNSTRVSFNISGISSQSKRFKISDARTVSKLDLPVQTISAEVLKNKYEHLKCIPISSYKQATPRILIGLDQLKLQLPLKVKEGYTKEPVGAKTRLGWTIYGSKLIDSSEYSTNKDKSFNFHICECDPDTELSRLVKEYFTAENVESPRQNIMLDSKEDQRARSILEATTVKHENYYELGLLWKYDEFTLPNSFPIAIKRYDCLKRKLSKNPELAANLDEQMLQYVKKGYARKLSEDELQQINKRVWYLPTFPICNPNKPGKIRIVWDAAAKTNGVSLNSFLLKGPDALSSLVGVLMRYRERKIALCADISEMFHQVKIRSEDQHCQRFLWPNSETDKPDVYIMQVMTFGATCSPSCAQYVMKRNAADFESQFPRAVLSILKNHYVDDMLDSCDTVEEAVELATNVHKIHQNAGFYIRNWISNSNEVIEQLGANNLHGKQKNLDITTELNNEKILGMWWNMSSDTFTYSSILNKYYLQGNHRPTKRQVLRTMMSIFDPLGFLSFYIVFIKILMQDIWRESLNWDDEVTDEHFERWNIWISLLPCVETINIPRCYLGENISYANCTVELHTFADASEEAYAAVSYIRIIGSEQINCSLVAAKSKVAPLKRLSIPRLELEAALLASRLAKSITSNLTVSISRQYFWIDSKVVKSWLISDTRKYKQFVAFRVEEILESTDPNQWQWIPSKMNVADDATKWQRTPNFKTTSRWFQGPEFLHEANECWPLTETSEANTIEEIRPQYICHINVENIQSLINLDRFSSWKSLLRCVAFVYRFVNNLRLKVKGEVLDTGSIKQHEYVKAENMLYRLAQVISYPDEVAHCIKYKGKMCPSLGKLSPLYKDCPMIDGEDVIRASGRINAVECVPDHVKSPVLLAADNYITQLIVKYYHSKYHHVNHEIVINELRQLYCIPKLRAVLKKVRRHCQVCKIMDAKPKPPRMAELPDCRLSPFTRPFSYTGLDYFGPINVVNGRKTEKKWGMILTCLTIRAIHIELVSSLSTDSCILGLRNFIARRGTPICLYSDCGTNFRGADKELQTAIKKIDQQKMIESFESTSTKWIFNPPASPHMGGSWERLIRSVKTSLYIILKSSRHPTEELLRSTLLEIENIINSRPLTYVPIENENDEALTPNHFLLGTSSGSKPIGIFNDDKELLRNNYMKSQQYSCHFWRRWIREYLPTLTRRTKWFEYTKPIIEGDIVIIVDENNPRNVWPKGRVVMTYPGKDGQVRRVKVQTSTGVYERPASKIAVLDVAKDGKSSRDEDIPGGNVTEPPKNN